MMLHDKLKHEVSQQFLLCDKFALLRYMTFMSCWTIHCTMTVKQVDAAWMNFQFDYL